MTSRTCLSIILAAGEGTRMKSAKPKVLHEIAGLPMVAHVAAAARAAGGTDLALVVGHGAEDVRKAAARLPAPPEIFVQEERLGTGHAVLSARAAIARGYDDILVMFGDTPLIEADALIAARKKLAEGAAVVVVGFRTPNPAGYGRLIEKGGKLTAIREDKDASEAEKRIEFCNGGLMAISGSHALALLDAVGNKNAKGEYYLTDIVEIAHARGLDVDRHRGQLRKRARHQQPCRARRGRSIWQRRRRRAMMLSGVTLIAPETVYFSHDTEIGPETIVEPNVWFGPGVKIASGAKIHAFCHIEGATDRTELRCRAVRPAASGRRPARKGKSRQFLRGQEGDDREGRQGQPPDLYRRRARRRGRQYRRRHHHLQLRRLFEIHHRHRRRRLRRLELVAGRARRPSATAPTSRRAASSPKACPTTRWPSAGRAKRPCRERPGNCGSALLRPAAQKK